MLERKLLMASRLVGSRAEDLASDLDLSTVWGALSAINLKIEEVRAGANKYVNSTQHADPLLANRVGQVEQDLLATVTHLSEAINSLRLKVDGMPPPSVGITNLTGVLSSGIAIDIQERVNKLSGEIENLRSDKKMISIKFSGLGFDSPQKENAWLMANVAPSDVGLIVDPHTVLEHIYAEENGDDFFKSFKERVHKLQILTLQQGYAMTSFQRAVPKFFANAGTRVVRDHSSFFDKIPTWGEWDHQHTGYRDTLKKGLSDFATSHRETIDIAFGDEATSKAYAVAILSLNKSVSIIEAWISFIDDYVKTLTIAKFNHKKAFHVTTMLARRLIIAIFEPQIGVLKTFKAGNMGQVSNAIFWSTLWALDVAIEIKRIGFANHALVSAELVKFLTVILESNPSSSFRIKLTYWKRRCLMQSKT
jgi:hypothetical protein